MLLFYVEALPEIIGVFIIAFSQYKRILGAAKEMLHKNLDIILCTLYNAKRKLNRESRTNKLRRFRRFSKNILHTVF